MTCGGVMAGVRRLRLAGRRAGQLHGGEERGAQRQLAARLRGHRRHQGAGRGLLQRHRLLRRHPRPRRARRRQPGQFSSVLFFPHKSRTLGSTEQSRGMLQLGGPSWTVPLGRRDARNTSASAANTNLPPPDAGTRLRWPSPACPPAAAFPCAPRCRAATALPRRAPASTPVAPPPRGLSVRRRGQLHVTASHAAGWLPLPPVPSTGAGEDAGKKCRDSTFFKYCSTFSKY